MCRKLDVPRLEVSRLDVTRMSVDWDEVSRSRAGPRDLIRGLGVRRLVPGDSVSVQGVLVTHVRARCQGVSSQCHSYVSTLSVRVAE